MDRLSRLAIFVSGEGTNFSALRQAIVDGRLPAEIALVVADRPSPAASRSLEWGLETLLVERKAFPREERDRRIMEALQKEEISHLILAGYLSHLPKAIVDAYFGRSLNVHPSLLPAFPGLDALSQALFHGVKVTGVTVHLVDEGMDTGPIVWQEPVSIRQGETKESLRERVRPLEHRGLIAATGWMISGRIRVTGRTTEIAEEVPR